MRGRYLSRNEGTEIPTNLLFFDTESRKLAHTSNPDKSYLALRLWVLVHVRLEGGKVRQRTVYKGTEGKAFWQVVNSLLQQKKRTWAFAHNAAFDLTQLDFWGELDKGNFLTVPIYSAPHPQTGERTVTWQGKLCVEPRPFFIVCRSAAGPLTIVDTCNYFPTRLSVVAEQLNMAKAELPPDDADYSAWFARCERDVEIIERAMIDILLEWEAADCGVFKPTAAMLALTNFMHTCDVLTPDGRKVDIVCKPLAREHELERKAYMGGRTTCFYVGEIREPVYHLDVNSLYPYIMREGLFPREFLFYRNGVDPNDLLAATACYGIVAEVLISSRSEVFPLRVERLQHHCTGRFWTVLCGAELQRALSSESVHRTGLCQYYALAPLFRKWVDYWYDRKSRASGALDNGRRIYQFSKLILNSLSGKFAQHGRGWTDRPGKIPPVRWGPYYDTDPVSGARIYCRAIGGNAQIQSTIGEPDHAFPAISAYITAGGREYMRDICDIAGAPNVYYLATDAILCNTDGLSNLNQAGCVHPSALGKLKLLGEYTYARIDGANRYQLGSRVVASGMHGAIVQALAEHREPLAFQSVTQTILRQPDGLIELTRIEDCDFKPDYRGIVGPDGWLIPYRLSFDPEWTDRPPRSGWAFSDSMDREPDRILVPDDV